MFDHIENVLPERSNREQLEVIEDIIDKESIQPMSVIAPVEEYPWPIFFSEKFPFSDIASFVEYPLYEEHELSVILATGRIPVNLEINNYGLLEKLIQEQRTELFFASNILDYRNHLEGERIANILANNDVKWILLVHDLFVTAKEKGATGYRAFDRNIQNRGYMVKKFVNPTNPFALQYYLAISPTNERQYLFEDFFKMKNIPLPTPA